MAINKVENTNDEKNFKFLTNQSSILLTSDTNNVTINGVNVIVDKPKVGDVMCVKNGQVVWIDGLSITPKQLSQEIEPVGICVSINGNKAMVRYRTEYTDTRWAAGDRLEIPYSSYMGADGRGREFKITLNGVEGDSSYFMYNTSASNANRYWFSYIFNGWLSQYHSDWSSELVKSDTYKPINDPSSPNVNQGIVIVTAKYTNDQNKISTIRIDGLHYSDKDYADGIPVTANHIGAINNYYKNNGFQYNYLGGCCRARFYQIYKTEGITPPSEMKSIDINLSNKEPVNENAFNGTNCKILQRNFASYDEYIDSMMIKYQCGKGGAVTKFPSGKENTYKLLDCTFKDGTPLYPAAHKVATISVDAPGLGAGNWWLPSVAEMVQMMHDVTYGIDSNINTDIVNTVLEKMFKFDSANWSMLSANVDRWTSSRYSNTTVYSYNRNGGFISDSAFYAKLTVSPITIYEF